MTAFTATQIPVTIRSVEQLVVWGMEILQHNYPSLEVVEFLDDNGDPVSRRAVESNKFFYTAPNPAQWRHSSRLSVPVSNQHQVSGHIWNHVKEFGDLPIPAGMAA